jgi:hypothetical protein
MKDHGEGHRCPMCGMGIVHDDLERGVCPRCATPLMPVDFGLTVAEGQRLLGASRKGGEVSAGPGG